MSRQTTHPLRKYARERAAQRQQARDARSMTEQLVELEKRPGNSARERQRLEQRNG